MKKQGLWIFRLVALLLFSFVIVFMGFHLITALSAREPTARALLYSTQDVLPVQGLFIREETLFPLPQGINAFQVADGERVSKGQAVAFLYENESARQNNLLLQEQKANLAQLTRAQSAGVDITDPSELDRQIATTVTSWVEAVDTRQMGALSDLSGHLWGNLVKRDHIFSGRLNLDLLIAETKNEITRLSSLIHTGVSEVTAPISGTFVSFSDGFESLLTPDTLNTLSPSAFSLLYARKPDRDMTQGRLVQSHEWAYAAVVSAQDAKLLSPGQSIALTVRLEGGLEHTFSLRISHIGPEENGQHLLVCTSTREMERTLRYRKLPGQILLRAYAGLRIPRETVRITDGQAGVYCLIGREAVFKPVSIQLERDDYYIVIYDPSASNALRPDDEIFLRTKDLFDGKVMKR